MMLEHYAGKFHHLLCVTVGCGQGADLAVELGNLSFAFLSVVNRLGSPFTLLYGTSVVYFQRTGQHNL